MSKTYIRLARRKKRQFRIRRKITGSAVVPRLSIFRSARHIYVQAVDDMDGRTVASASTCEKELREHLEGAAGNRVAAVQVGKAIAERLGKLGIAEARFDRGGNRYHGRVQALADAAREAGLKF